MAQDQRIQKALGDGGILSRRKTEEYIKAGRITVNGHRAEIGQSVNIAKDIIAIDGKRVIIARRKENIYIMLNKPRGYVTTTSDELGRRCVTELVEDVKERVYPVGRLDKNTEGLLLLTNDGQFTNLITHPSSHITKTYRLTVRPDITDIQAARLAAGVDIGEGEITQPAQVHIIEKQAGRVVIQISITEGKNRQIRRMCEAVGLEVARLKRVSVGPQKLGMLQPGEWRELKKSEVIALRNAGKPADQQEAMPSDGKKEKVGSFGQPGKRAVRRKDSFVGKREREDKLREDDYTFKGGYKPSYQGTGDRGKEPGAAKTGYQGKSTTGGYKGVGDRRQEPGAAKTGYQGKPATGGYQGKPTTGGYQGKPTTGGYQGKSTTGGYQGKSTTGGYQGKSTTGGYQGRSEPGSKPGAKPTVRPPKGAGWAKAKPPSRGGKPTFKARTDFKGKGRG